MDRRRKHPGPRSFYSLATKLGIMSDASSGIPRTAYKGVVTVYYSGIRVFLVPEGGMSATYKCDLFLWACLFYSSVERDTSESELHKR